MLQAVIFDLDGVLLDSEQLWDQVRRQVAAEHGGHWRDDATAAMQGMSSPEWSAYMHDRLGVDLTAEDIVDHVVDGLRQCYRQHLPLLAGAQEAVRRVARRWPLALASSSNRVLIDEVLVEAGLSGQFTVTLSSEEVAKGKPAPDVYLEAARRLGHPPQVCAAVEDSANGIRSAVAAGMRVVAVPNREYPPPHDVLASTDLVLDGLADLTVEQLQRLGEPRGADVGEAGRGR